MWLPESMGFYYHYYTLIVQFVHQGGRKPIFFCFLFFTGSQMENVRKYTRLLCDLKYGHSQKRKKKCGEASYSIWEIISALYVINTDKCKYVNSDI